MPHRPTDTADQPLLVEDLLLLLFDPDSGAIAGEGTLFYVLAGAVLTELALDGRVEIEDSRGLRGNVVRAIGDTPPADPVLRTVWERIADKPRDVQIVLADVGPTLRATVLDRLEERGHIRRESRRALGLFPTTKLLDNGTPRRATVLGDVRAALVDGAAPTARTAALAGLLSASGALPSLHRDIPWSSPVIKRAKALETGDWGAAAAAAAVTRTMNAVIANQVVVSGAIGSR